MALAALLWAPLGISHGDMTMVTGHSTFYNGSTYDPCLGSIAGIMRNRVMWFNDQVLAESYGGKGTFIYVTEAGAPDPRAYAEIFTEGVFYDFIDPNGAHWHVEEAFYGPKWVQDTGKYEPPDPYVEPDNPQPAGFNDMGEIRPPSRKLEGDKWMVWFVELAPRPIYDEFAGDDPHTYYNFLVMADTCKMHNNTGTYDGEEYHDTAAELNDDNGHENGADPHQHGRFMVDLWVGKRPTVAIAPSPSTDGAEWESEWAQGEANDAAPDGPDPSGDPNEFAPEGSLP